MTTPRRLAALALLAFAVCTPTRGIADAPKGRYCVTPGQGDRKATVLDTGTGLTWLQAQEPSVYTQPAAIQRCAGLHTNGKEWRLPSMKEMLTLSEIGTNGGDLSVFPDSKGNSYWSATAYAAEAGNAWLVGASGVGPRVTSEQHKVRCVMRDP